MKKTLLICIACVVGCIAAFAQWNSDPAVNLSLCPDGQYIMTSEMDVAPNGNIWFVRNYLDDDTKTAVHLLDSAGNFLFEEEIVIGEYNTRTWSSVEQILLVDRDGNAIVAVVDQRYSTAERENYTVYKISQEGVMLWGEDGISLQGETTYDFAACMSMTQIADGSYVFAWVHTQDGNSNMQSIEMQRVSPDGELLWEAEDVRIHDEKVTASYPYLVDANFNQVIVVWASGSNQDLYARKLDFDGTPVWSEDTRIYRGGFGSIPLWTLLDVEPSGDGGVLLSWNDDRNFTNIESAYMSYVKPNGELGFMDGEDALKLGHAGWRSLNVKCLYDKASDSFYAIWNECNSGQTFYRVVAQRVSKEGELLWNEEGLELKPMEDVNYAYNSLQSGADGEIAFYYMCNYAGTFGDVEAFVTAVDAENPDLRRESEFTKGNRVSEKSQLETTAMYDNKFWIAKWKDAGTVEDAEKIDRQMIQRINNDFTLGNPDKTVVESVNVNEYAFEALSTCVDEMAMFAVNVPNATVATLAVYNMNGALVATPFCGELTAGKQYIEWNADVTSGIYLATFTTSQGVKTVKLLVK